MKISSTLLTIVCLSNIAVSQDFFRLRNNPDLILVSDESIMKIDSQKTHSDLSDIVSKAILETKEASFQGDVASGKFELIYSDATIVSGNFQTPKKEQYFFPLASEDGKASDKTEPNLQIANLVVNSPFLIKTIARFDKKLNFGIFHVFSENDPSANSRKIWSKILEDLNKDGLDGLIQKHAASLEKPDDLKKIIETRQNGFKPRFIAIMTSRHQFGNARYKCFDGFSLPVPNILDARTEKTSINVHPFSIMPTPYNIFSHFLDSEEPATSLAAIPVTGQNLLTSWQELLAKSIELQEKSAIIQEKKAESTPEEQSAKRAIVARPMPIRGFVNIGNTCYFNATVQGLSALDSFKGIVRSRPLNDQIPFNLASVFSDFFNASNSDSEKSQSVVPMRDFFGNVQKFLDLKSKLCDAETEYMYKKAGRKFTKPSHFSEQIANHRLEHDSSELLTYILELLRIESEHRGDDVVADYDTKIGIVSSTTTSCKACKAKTTSETTDNILKITLSKTNLKECFEGMIREEVLSADNRWSCGTADCSGETVRQFKVTKWPDILIVQLNRFLTPMTKITSKINYSENMDFDGQKYNLRSVIMHHGNSIQAGHYTATLKTPNGEWYFADDSRIRGPIPFSVLSDAYILLFEKN